jgi:hypothetical protein
VNLVLLGVLVGIAAVVVAIATVGWMIATRRVDLSTAKEASATARASAEKELVNSLLRWLEGRRVLWKPAIHEVPVEAVDSIMKIRDRIDADIAKLSKPEAQSAAASIRQACLTVLDQPQGQLGGGSGLEDTLQAFRDQVIPAANTLARMYGLSELTQRTFTGGFEDVGVRLRVPTAPAADVFLSLIAQREHERRDFIIWLGVAGTVAIAVALALISFVLARDALSTGLGAIAGVILGVFIVLVSASSSVFVRKSGRRDLAEVERIAQRREAELEVLRRAYAEQLKRVHELQELKRSRATGAPERASTDHVGTEGGP